MNRGLGNPFALGLVVVGAAVMAIAAFLPLLEPNRHIPHGSRQHPHSAWRLATHRTCRWHCCRWLSG